MSSSDFQEYLELHAYFGRDGLPRLGPEEFVAYRAEVAALIERAPELEAEDVRRFLALQQLLLRERPTIKSLLSCGISPRRGGGRGA